MGMFSVTKGSFEGLDEGRELKHKSQQLTAGSRSLYRQSLLNKNVETVEPKVECDHSNKRLFQTVYIPNGNLEWKCTSYRCLDCKEIVQEKHLGPKS